LAGLIAEPMLANCVAAAVVVYRDVITNDI
jgi:hypothetical protein